MPQSFCALYLEGQSDVYPPKEPLEGEPSMELEDFDGRHDSSMYCQEVEQESPKEESEDEEMASTDQLTAEQRRLVTLVDEALEFNRKFIRSLHIAPFEPEEVTGPQRTQPERPTWFPR
ncbi:hypothetical protein NMY22_g18994 [Coprinellus aureogranulatus]|nr:hypothetical protein NMY22_g18994 [Coprinellus aureogranulatus]